MKVLVACEESDEVRGRLEAMGLDAWSCDLQPSRNPNNKKHIQGDVLAIMNDGTYGAMIGFPPCTHLAASGSMWFEKKRADGRQQAGIDFFMAMVNAPIRYIAIENPVGIMSKLYKPPTQIIQPFYFGDEAQKTTCLWLKGLPRLYHNAAPNLFDEEVTHVGKGEFFEWVDGKTGKKKRQPLWYSHAKHKDRAKTRSKTFPGIANAMATQWGDFLLSVENN